MALKATVPDPSGSMILSIEPGAVVCDDQGRNLIIRRFDSAEAVVVRNLATGTDEILPLSAFSRQQVADRTQELHELSNSEWQEVLEKFNLICPLLERRTTEQVDLVAEKAQVSRATVYRWIRTFQEGGVVTSLLRKRRKDAGLERLDPRVEEIITQVINGFFLTNQKRKKRKAYREVERLCRKQQLSSPSFSAFDNRLKKIASKDYAEKREGKNAALRFDLIDGTVPNVDAPYSVIQIDHTPVDIILVDEEHRIPIGRPWITVAIDVYSRCVAGYYVSFDPPGTLATGICIANAILPKDKLLAQLGMDVSWPCMGLPRVIHLDNAKEFRGNTLKMACNEYGINLIFRKVKRPNYGGHIERYLGTLAEEIHSLPGTTFSNKKDREGYNSEKHAAMTLKEFELWLANKILGMYHYEKHSELGAPPLKRYNDAILGSESQPGIGAITIVRDEERLRVDFLPLVERTIQPYGVLLDNIKYFSDVLRRWVGARDSENQRLKRKFLFRRDPRDISYLLFYDPEARQYYRIPYQDTSKPPMSLWELKAVQRWLADQGKKAVDQEQIFRAYDEMRRIEEQAKTTTRKVRLMRERRKHHQEAASSSGQPKVEMVEEPEWTPEWDPSQLQPFDEIEKL